MEAVTSTEEAVQEIIILNPWQTPMHARVRFRTLLEASVVAAFGSASMKLYFFQFVPHAVLMLLLSVVRAVLWCVFVVAAITWYRWRGLWLLVCLPLIVYQPLMTLWLLAYEHLK